MKIKITISFAAWGLALFLLAASPAAADEVALSTGPNLKGTILRMTADSILLLREDGKTQMVKRDQSKSFDLNFAAGGRWARLISNDAKNILMLLSSFENSEFAGKDEDGKPVKIALGDIKEAVLYPVAKLSQILDMPYVRQKPDYCGEACVEMVSTFLDRPVSQDKVNELAGLAGKRGCYGGELAAVIDKLDLRIASGGSLPGKTDDDFLAERMHLLACLRKNHPVLLGLWGNYQRKKPGMGFDHIVLLIGYDLKSERFIIHDTARMPDWEVSFADFIKHRENSSGMLSQIEFALFRKWKTLEGTEISAELLEMSESTILLKPEKGENLTLLIDKLDAPCRAFVEKLKAGRKAPVRQVQSDPPITAPDPYALYSSACECALKGDKAGALSFLAQAVDAGFISFVHIQNDKDLVCLHEEKEFKDLLANKDRILADFPKKMTVSLLKKLGDKYKVVSDANSPYIVISDADLQKLKVVDNVLRVVSDLLGKTLFKNKPTTAIIVVVPCDMQDFVQKMGGKQTSAGFYNHATRTLTVNLATGAGTIAHEFTHALHCSDMEAREQVHPVWVREGLGSLYEECDPKGDHLEGLVNWRLPILKNALQSGQAYKLRELFTNSLEHFQSNARLSYAMSRYVFYFLQSKQLLFPWYAQYCKNYAEDPTGILTLEKVYGKSLEEFEKDWIEFVKTLK